MRFAPVIVAFSGVCGLVATYGIGPVTGPAAWAKNTAIHAYQAATQSIRPLEPEAPLFGSDEPAFRYASIERGSIEQTVTVTGALQPVKTIEVGSQLSGQLSKVHVDFNDPVRKDQPLAQIDPRTFAAKVDEARAVLETALAFVELEKAKLDRAKSRPGKCEGQQGCPSRQARKRPGRQELGAEDPATEADAAVAECRGDVTTVDDAQTEFTATRGAGARGRDPRVPERLLGRGSTSGCAQDRSRIAPGKDDDPGERGHPWAAQADLDRTVIRSPIDGVVVGRFVNEGQTLAVGLEFRPTFVVAHRLEDMEIHAQVDEADIGRISSGQRAHFTVDSYPDRRFEAVVRQVRKAPQNQQHVVTYTVVLSTSNLDGALLPGMTALVKIVIEQQDNVLKVPVAALRFQPRARSWRNRSRTHGVWVRTASGALQRVPVIVGAAGAEQVALKGGELVEGSQVVIGQAIRPAAWNCLASGSDHDEPSLQFSASGP